MLALRSSRLHILGFMRQTHLLKLVILITHISPYNLKNLRFFHVFPQKMSFFIRFHSFFARFRPFFALADAERSQRKLFARFV